MSTRRLGLAIIVVALLVSVLAGCSAAEIASVAPTLGQQIEQSKQNVAENQYNLEKVIPTPQLTYSNERANLAKRATTFGSDQNKVSWIYLFADNGVIIAYSSVKGKVSNLSSYMVPDMQIVKDPYTQTFEGSQGQVLQAPDIDGSYGTNGAGIFWYDTAGIYHEWNGLYYVTDQPVQLRQQPIVIMQDSGK